MPLDYYQPSQGVDVLHNVLMSEYQTIGIECAEWVDRSEELPPVFLENIQKKITDKTSIRELLDIIRNELFTMYGDRRNSAASFADSRFTPLSQMIECGLTSCGAKTAIMGAALLTLGIPVQFVHGIDVRGEGSDARHSWLNVYNPNNYSWIGVDVGEKDFEIKKTSSPLKIYHDWQELKTDYDKNEY